jgi:hypothetical protein
MMLSQAGSLVLLAVSARRRRANGAPAGRSKYIYVCVRRSVTWGFTQLGRAVGTLEELLLRVIL